MLREKGKRLPNSLEYAGMLLPVTSGRDDLYVNQYGVHTDPTHESILTIETKPGHFRFAPGPEFSPRLYRGQNHLWKPCKASLFRCKAIDGMYWTAKILDLGTLLRNHPAMVELLSWNIEGLKFDLSLEALAQHYGWPTVFLDFSRSRDVAMFFATCAYDSISKNYFPLTEGEGVLYIADLKMLLTNPEFGALPFGFEPLPRPEAQSAFGVAFNVSDDLNEMSWVEAEKVEITPQVSNMYFDMFQGGQTLFPPDSFELNIDSMHCDGRLSLGAIKLASTLGVLPPHPEGIDGIVRSFELAGYQVVQSIDEVSEESLIAAEAEWRERRASFVTRIKIRGVSNHLAMPQQPFE